MSSRSTSVAQAGIHRAGVPGGILRISGSEGVIRRRPPAFGPPRLKSGMTKRVSHFIEKHLAMVNEQSQKVVLKKYQYASLTPISLYV